MLKHLTSRAPTSTAGEPEAWEPQRGAPDRAHRPAPWRSPYPAERPAAPEDYRPAPRASRPAPAPAPAATAEDFRTLARTIERLRRAPAYAAEPEPAPRARPSWLDEVRTTIRREEERVEEDRFAALAREVARAADKEDVARLEEMLTHVLRRLNALEERRTARSDTARPAPRDHAEPARPARTSTALRTEPEPRPASPRSTGGTAPRRLWP